eukprot:Gb_38881 [translate_table: standard]
MYVLSCAHEEASYRKDHHGCRDSQTPAPADVFLNVYDDGECDHHGHCECQIIPVEEALYASPSLLACVIELICSKG